MGTLDPPQFEFLFKKNHRTWRTLVKGSRFQEKFPYSLKPQTKTLNKRWDGRLQDGFGQGGDKKKRMQRPRIQRENGQIRHMPWMFEILQEFSGRLESYDAGMKQKMVQKTQHVRIGLADLMSFQTFGLPENRMATGYKWFGLKQFCHNTNWAFSGRLKSMLQDTTVTKQ